MIHTVLITKQLHNVFHWTHNQIYHELIESSIWVYSTYDLSIELNVLQITALCLEKLGKNFWQVKKRHRGLISRDSISRS